MDSRFYPSTTDEEITAGGRIVGCLLLVAACSVAAMAGCLFL